MNRTKPNRSKTDPRRTAVYRWFAGDHLLYVGSSINPAKRWQAIENAHAWPRLSDHRTVEWFPDSGTALAAELEAIRTERPLLNLGGRSRRCPFSQHWRTLQMPDGSTLTLMSAGPRWLIGDEEIYEYLEEDAAQERSSGPHVWLRGAVVNSRSCECAV